MKNDAPDGVPPDVAAVLADAEAKFAAGHRPATPRSLGIVRPAEPARFDVAAARRHYDRLVRFGVAERLAAFISGAEELAGGRPRPQPTMALGNMDDFLTEAHGGRANMVVLAGPVGTGKTVAAVSMLESGDPRLPFGKAWGNEAGPMFLHATELLAMGLYDEDEKRRQIKLSKAVVLDDLGAEYMDGKGVWQCFIDWFINARSGAAGFTAITTNLPSEIFRQRYGERTFDRLREVAMWFDVVGPSMRAPR